MPPVAKLERRVVTAAEQALERQRHVCPLDVLTGMGWLPPGLVTDWRQGRAPDLESVAAVSADRLTDALEIFHRWVEGRGLRPSEVDYPSATRDRRPLRFTAAADPALERAYRTHWMPADLPERQRDRLTARQSKPPDLVVVLPLRDFTCASCGHHGAEMLTMEDAGPICLTCADLDHLVFLPAGDAALTRRAKAASRLSAVVVRFNRSRKRHERQGLLVEQAALDQAEQQCLSDEEARARRRERDRERREAADETFQHDLAAEITRLFPGCPPPRAESISRHTSLRGSGRVGRSAAGRALDPDAVTRAVIASVRHEDTSYDELLMSGVPRDEARAQIRDAIDRILTRWR
ncbi:hypothetical protein FHR83_007935 [Actinoplanes campanulatus]|uniref:DUF2293 domain-containing protein n=1 Tax=Actinoplanes campanulatus TaxID=113559 RepID=A0A7W5AQ20_9ACTN|nr:DUF2293 domain-containing protein [Actinoplanes campanulatus]MBB3100215.1 hypothetical protein [Actinoplanes campanulatus]GGN28931.1 hypothetical protein GCM10010109_47510 [Actinoplanes campanulatus]GID38973.1 hypothetical protein Aca09nite_54790 [Actinoplanes campanulatus]